MTQAENRKIPVGISSCLLGERVRFDGGHKHDGFVTGTLGEHFDWIAVCPEVEIGLGTPRENIRLVGTADAPRLVAPKSGTDHTKAMTTFAARRARALLAADIRGFILKKDSPSCGPDRIRVYDQNNVPSRTGRGLFAAALMDRAPLLPTIDEGRLNDPPLRENFIERVFAYDRWLRFRASKPKAKDLVAFHTHEKMRLLSHSRAHHQRLGRLVADAGARPMGELLDEYATVYMEALAVRATRKKHADVLSHLAGHLKKVIDDDDRAELHDRIDAYRRGLVPLVVPLTLLNHHFRRQPSEWANGQTYLEPYPAELMLRNHV